MRILTGNSVYEEAIKRINWLFDEFENVTVSFSGGKDSTVILQLTLKVAEERGRLPLKVIFIDQEAEWTATIDYMKIIMYDARVDPYWMQVPLKLLNATSNISNWLHCWEKGVEDKWIHPQDPISKKENKYGTDRFAQLFTAIINTEFKDVRTANIGGVRTQESPARYLGLTSQETYKGVTWGKQLNKELDHYTFYPIYDWGYKDVWKYIVDNNFPYCKLYDTMYQYGITINNMRVSNVHHETAVGSLYFLQEVDPVVWGRLTARISGINTTGHLKKESITVPDELPPMFASWFEYRDFLLRKMVSDKNHVHEFRKHFDTYDEIYAAPKINKAYCMTCISAILVNEPLTKLANFRTRSEIRHYRAYLAGRRVERFDSKNKYIKDYLNNEAEKRSTKKVKGRLRFSKK